MSTDLMIKGQRYDLEKATKGVGLNLLVFMKKRLGVTLKQVVESLRSIAAADSELDLVDDEGALDGLRALVWVCRTQAGDRGDGGRFLTLEEANDGIGLNDFDWINDDEEPEPDPKDEPSPSSPSGSTTSSETSTSTSSPSPTSGQATPS